MIPYEEYNGSWYYYAKATNEVGTRYVSTPNIIIDADPAVALEYPSGKELTGKYGQTESGTYWGDLQFTVVDESEFTVKDGSTPLEPDENDVYTIKADMDEGIKHEIVIMDAGNNRTAYINEIRMNTLDRRDNPSALNLPNGANLEESLPKTVRILTARDSSMFTNIPVIWEIPETYEQASKREQSFTVNGTLDLSGTDIVLHPDKTELGKAQISVTIAGAPRYTLTIADSANGSITVVNATETAEDGKPLFFKDELVMLSIAPNEGYMLSALSVNGIPATVAVGDDTYTFAQPEENVTITATFEKRNEHTITFDANGGSEPKDLPEEVTTAMPAKKVLHGSEYYLPECEFIAPEGKQFKAWQIDGTEYPVNAPVTVTADITVKALWEDAPPAPTEYIVTVTNDGNGIGTATPSTAAAGTEITLTATPDGGYHFKEWQVVKGGVTIQGNKFTMPGENVEIKAIFEKNTSTGPIGTGMTTYPITVMNSKNGGVTASHKSAAKGALVTLTVTPDKGYVLETLNAFDQNGNALPLTQQNGKYGFTMPASAVTVKATFMDDNTMLNFFVDVSASDYYYDAVLWAVGKGITGDTSATTFDPSGNCTRAQIVTFLWRTAGSPVVNYLMPFTDVDEGAYYAEAVRWAASEKIVEGTTAATFAPNATVTRAQVVTMLCRFAKAQGMDTTQGGMTIREFDDFDAAPAYALEAMDWAVNAGVLKGDNNRLLPQNACTRAQIVTFLWRVFSK